MCHNKARDTESGAPFTLRELSVNPLEALLLLLLAAAHSVVLVLPELGVGALLAHPAGNG